MLQGSGIPITLLNRRATVRKYVLVLCSLDNDPVFGRQDTKRLEQARKVAWLVFESDLAFTLWMFIDPPFSGEGQRGALRYSLEFSERPCPRGGF